MPGEDRHLHVRQDEVHLVVSLRIARVQMIVWNWFAHCFCHLQSTNPHGKCNTRLPRVVKSWTNQQPVRQADGQETDAEEGRDDPPAQKTPRAPYSTDPRKRLDVIFAAHPLLPILPTAKKQHLNRRCRVCARKGLQKETSYYCKSCGVALHFGECYTL